MRALAICFTLVLGAMSSQAQEKIYETFASTRVINNYSNEMLPQQTLEFIVAHKFGDIAGASGGLENFFGFDNLADVRIAFEYGILDQLDVGIGRSKGVGLRTQIIDGYAKYAILSQKSSGMPLSLTFVSSIALSYAKATENPGLISSYPRFLNRLIYTNQLLITRQFHPRLSAQLNVGYNHRNFVDVGDENGLLFIGAAGRARFTKMLGLLVEYNQVLNRPSDISAQAPLSVGLEILTGGHAFALHFSNGKGLNENIFIPGTNSNWLDGQFRFGFSINRRFKL